MDWDGGPGGQQEIGGGGGGGKRAKKMKYWKRRRPSSKAARDRIYPGGAAEEMDQDRSDMGGLSDRRYPLRRCRKIRRGNGGDVVDGGGRPSPFRACRHLLQPPETTTTGGCPAISGMPPINDYSS